jgi:hypothetical protein
MSQSKSTIQNKYIVEESIIDEYIQKKDALSKERNCKSKIGKYYTILITFLHYLDIASDLYLGWKYYINRDIWWFRITLGIVILSSFLNTFILFFYSYLQEFKFYWKKKQYLRIIIKSFCLLFQLEMLFW